MVDPEQQEVDEQGYSHGRGLLQRERYAVSIVTNCIKSVISQEEKSCVKQ